MEFLIAFFGIIYIIVRLSCEGDAKRENKRRVDKARAIADELSVSDYISADIKQRILGSASRNEILEEISEEMEYVFGDTWRDKFDFVVRISGFSYEPGRVVYNLYLAKHGKICPIEYYSGFDLHGTGEQMLVVIRMCRMMEKNMQEQHPGQGGLRMIFVPRFVDPKNGKYSDSLVGGSIRWEFGLTGIGGKCNPPTLLMNQAEAKCLIEIEDRKKASL